MQLGGKNRMTTKMYKVFKISIEHIILQRQINLRLDRTVEHQLNTRLSLY